MTPLYIAQSLEEQQEAELDCPQTAVEQIQYYHLQRMEGIQLVDEFRSGDSRASREGELAVHGRLLRLPDYGTDEEHEPGGKDNVVIDVEGSGGLQADEEAEQYEEEGDGGASPGDALL